MYTVLGIRPYDFNKDGKHISGVSLFCSYEDENVSGLATEKINVSSEKFDSSITVGSIIEPNYNKYGTIIGIEIFG